MRAKVRHRRQAAGLFVLVFWFSRREPCRSFEAEEKLGGLKTYKKGVMRDSILE